MNEAVRELINNAAIGIVDVWAPSLAEIDRHWRDRLADWERVFPGLVALIGFQTLLWPHFVRAAGASPAAGRPPYVSPTADGQVWRFAYSPAGPKSAWSFASGPGSAPWDATLAVLNQDDVRQTLATLTEDGKVVTYGQASVRLRPLQGDMGRGDRPLRLPFCDCAAIDEMYPEWRASMTAVAPLLSDARQRLLSLDSEPDPALAYACLAWNVWGELLRRGCIVAGAKDGARGLARLAIKSGPPPFVGVLILHGDHYALWERIAALA